MAEHYTNSTTGVLKYCPTCNKKTMHQVSGKRLGLCENSHYKPKDKPEPILNNQRELF